MLKPEDVSQVMQILVTRSSNNEFIFANLSINPFGNYVMKKFLVQCDVLTLQPLYLMIKRNPELLLKIGHSEYGSVPSHKHSLGQRVYQIIEK
jgi:pumilio RNA-binding family